jgi:hypothetical protein
MHKFSLATETLCLLPNRTSASLLITMASLSAFKINKRDKVPGVVPEKSSHSGKTTLAKETDHDLR